MFLVNCQASSDHSFYFFFVLSPLPSPDDVLGALQGVIGRRHPSTAQSRQLKQTLPTLSIVQELLLSQVAWTIKSLLCEGVLKDCLHDHPHHFSASITISSPLFFSTVLPRGFSISYNLALCMEILLFILLFSLALALPLPDLFDFPRVFSQVLRSQIVTEGFLLKMGSLLVSFVQLKNFCLLWIGSFENKIQKNAATHWTVFKVTLLNLLNMYCCVPNS